MECPTPLDGLHRRLSSLASMVASELVQWLLADAAGPAVIALPVEWTASAIVGATRRWWATLNGRDDLAKLLHAAELPEFGLTTKEAARLKTVLTGSEAWAADAQGRSDEARTIERVVTQIAACLPPNRNRSKADIEHAARTIARCATEFLL